MSVDKKVYLTFDMEWANDNVLKYFYNLLKEAGVPATIFVTHETKWLEIFRGDSQIELGIHPNFNKLLLGESEGNNYKKIFDDLMRIVPEAVSYRSHSLTTSSGLIAYAAQKGLRFDLNNYVQILIYKFFRKRYNMIRPSYICFDWRRAVLYIDESKYTKRAGDSECCYGSFLK